MIRRGEIYWVNFDPIIGSEISKTRPGLVVSNDINNEAADTITVLPVTSNVDRVYLFEVFLPKKLSGLPSDSKIKANQIRTIDKKRLGNLMGSVDQTVMAQIERALKLHLDLT